MARACLAFLPNRGDGWFYKRNLSPINVQDENGAATMTPRVGPVISLINVQDKNGAATVAARFGPVEHIKSLFNRILGGVSTVAACFGPVERVAQKPSLAAISGGNQ